MRLDWADVKPSLWSLAMVTLLAIVGIVLMKWAVQKLPDTSLTNSVRDLVNSV